MEKVSILLVDNPYFNITRIDSALREAGLRYSLYFAGSGKNGLDILMGDPFYDLDASDSFKLKPTVVILSKELKDLSAFEFLGIVGKYYSLRDVKIFLLSDTLTDEERFVYQELGVCGFLQRPLDKEQVMNEIRPHVNGKTYFALAPIAFSVKLKKVRLGTFIKSKIASMGGVGTKAAACILSALMISGVAQYNADKRVKENLSARVVETPEQTIEQDLTSSPLLPPSTVAASISNAGLAPKKQEKSHRDKIVPAISPTVTDLDTLKVLPQKNENAVPHEKPRNLRIIAIEEPDSLSN
jgi:CheY-like chemotaxis protein